MENEMMSIYRDYTDEISLLKSHNNYFNSPLKKAGLY